MLLLYNKVFTNMPLLKSVEFVSEYIIFKFITYRQFTSKFIILTTIITGNLHSTWVTIIQFLIASHLYFIQNNTKRIEFDYL